MKSFIFIVLTLVVACRSATKPPNKIDLLETETNVTIRWDTVNYSLQSCTATLKDINLNLYIDKQSEALSDYAITISQKEGEVKVVMEQPWSLTDSSYVPPRFRILRQNVKLNKDHYQVGDHLQGELKLLVAGHRGYFRETGETMLRNKWDTINVFGIFSSNIK